MQQRPTRREALIALGALCGACGGTQEGDPGAGFDPEAVTGGREEPPLPDAQGATCAADVAPGVPGVVQGPAAKDVGLFDAVRVGNSQMYMMRDAGGLFVVLNRCTHLSCVMAYNRDTSTWLCPCHGSSFNYQGQRIGGLADRPLVRYPVCKQADGTTLIDTRKPAT